MKSYTIQDRRGNKHEFIERWHDRLSKHFYHLDGRQIVVDDQYGYFYTDTERPVNKYLVEQIDKITGLPETGVDKESEWE